VGVPSTPPAASPSDALAAFWIKPADNSTVKAYRLDLAATTAGDGATQVEFKVQWLSGSFGGCSATQPTTDRTWSCTVDLLMLGVPPGRLKVSFDVLDASGTATAGLAPARTITYVVAPPRPETKYTQVSVKYRSDGSRVEVDKITWTEPKDYATEFRLYGVIGCPNESEATDGQPCVVEHMQLPLGSLKLIKKVDGTTRSMVLTHTITAELCGPSLWCGDFGALVLGAYNRYGQSIFAIPVSSDVCYGCTY